MGGLFKTALAGWWNDRAMSLGAAIAFFTVFSLAPMLLVAIAVAGLAFSREAAQGAIVEELGGLVGGQTGAALEAMIASAGHFDTGVVGLVLGVATFLFLATGAIIELQDDLDIVWKVKPPETYGSPPQSLNANEAVRGAGLPQSHIFQFSRPGGLL